MRAVIQRVKNATVTIDHLVTAAIESGLLVFVGIEDADSVDDIVWLSSKITQLRVFNDAEGIMNLSIKRTRGDLLLVSQFTLHASTRKGNRPSYIRASKPSVAIPLYEQMIFHLESALGKKIATGVFGADMQVALVNDGPVTIFIDTKQKE